MTDKSLEELINQLRPRSRPTTMECVEQAGIDVSGWRTKKDGSECAIPAANPHYCYEYCFGGDGEPKLFSIWHDRVEHRAGKLIVESQLRYHVEPAQTANHQRRRRARKFEAMMETAAATHEPIRVMLAAGTSSPALEQRVEKRALDPVNWTVVSFDGTTGKYRLERNSP